MSYDDPSPEQTTTNFKARSVERAKMFPTESHDLADIMNTLTIAAIILRTKIDTTFTREELIAEAHSLCGVELKLHDEDMLIVIVSAGKRAFEGLQ